MTDGPSRDQRTEENSGVDMAMSMYDCLLNQSQQQDGGKCLSMHKFDSINHVSIYYSLFAILPIALSWFSGRLFGRGKAIIIITVVETSS